MGLFKILSLLLLVGIGLSTYHGYDMFNISLLSVGLVSLFVGWCDSIIFYWKKILFVMFIWLVYIIFSYKIVGDYVEPFAVLEAFCFSVLIAMIYRKKRMWDILTNFGILYLIFNIIAKLINHEWKNW